MRGGGGKGGSVQRHRNTPGPDTPLTTPQEGTPGGPARATAGPAPGGEQALPERKGVSPGEGKGGGQGGPRGVRVPGSLVLLPALCCITLGRPREDRCTRTPSAGVGVGREDPPFPRGPEPLPPGRSTLAGSWLPPCPPAKVPRAGPRPPLHGSVPRPQDRPGTDGETRVLVGVETGGRVKEETMRRRKRWGEERGKRGERGDWPPSPRGCREGGP